jgi:hypothetical protein
MIMATLVPALRTAAALRTSSSSGRIRGLLHPTLENTAPCIFGGESWASASWMSSGMMIVATERVVSAVLNARSITCRAWAGLTIIWQYSETSENSWSSATSCC